MSDTPQKRVCLCSKKDEFRADVLEGRDVLCAGCKAECMVSVNTPEVDAYYCLPCCVQLAKETKDGGGEPMEAMVGMGTVEEVLRVLTGKKASGAKARTAFAKELGVKATDSDLHQRLAAGIATVVRDLYPGGAHAPDDFLAMIKDAVIMVLCIWGARAAELTGLRAEMKACIDRASILSGAFHETVQLGRDQWRRAESMAIIEEFET